MMLLISTSPSTKYTKGWLYETDRYFNQFERRTSNKKGLFSPTTPFFIASRVCQVFSQITFVWRTKKSGNTAQGCVTADKSVPVSAVYCRSNFT